MHKMIITGMCLLMLLGFNIYKSGKKVIEDVNEKRNSAIEELYKQMGTR